MFRDRWKGCGIGVGIYRIFLKILWLQVILQVFSEWEFFFKYGVGCIDNEVVFRVVKGSSWDVKIRFLCMQDGKGFQVLRFYFIFVYMKVFDFRVFVRV